MEYIKCQTESPRRLIPPAPALPTFGDEQASGAPYGISLSPRKTLHPCQFSIELVQRCIVTLTNSGDTVFDPFMGVGSTLIAAMLHDRRGLGFEIDDNYIQIAEKRINGYLNNNLKIRPRGNPVYTPTGREKVSQIPLSWVTDAAQKLI